ncbi:helix-hairpin-helix domain-containing protein [Gracilibacillus sp. YIM 98692]|uniref:helix-hairpin-helix domain-containing protein n=1 Tax=Gracilibacillus sp. YIM 98692 TaxID=2663532 RepID=UPI0013CFC4FE|nr:helix-hairpin-helix domain-containing protein [Gracilibacillus sp. YIM 98692]
MYWFKKYWYFIFIVAVIFIWFWIDTSSEPSKQNNSFVIDEMEEETDDSTEKQQDVVLMVDIKGEVRQPGVFEVQQDYRVKDVVEKAGGFTEKADVSSINLAERVFDEMVIMIPSAEGNEVESIMSTHDGKVRINNATLEEITEIPGIGNVKGNAIVEYRDTHGKFQSMSDLQNVSGIGEKTAEMLEEHVQIP